METISTINHVVRSQIEDAGEVLDLTVALFDTTLDILRDGERIDNIHEPVLTTQNYQPNGCTALLDAVATVIDRVGARLSARTEQDRPTAVIVAIMTDGLENASERFTLADVARRIDHQQRVYNWQFLFLGANQDAWATGQALGVQRDDAQSWTSTEDGMANLSVAMDVGIKLRKERARGN